MLPAKWRRAIDTADHMAAFLEAVNLAGFSEAEARSVVDVNRRIASVKLGIVREMTGGYTHRVYEAVG
ncbi:MAG: hypothetical protein HQL40_09795 [Alphaproteobacteria bacterium]|nr:hypothetical protein [Alphaproteobacteria bacterium]